MYFSIEQIFTNEKLIIIQKVHYYSLLCNEKKVFVITLYIPFLVLNCLGSERSSRGVR